MDIVFLAKLAGSDRGKNLDTGICFSASLIVLQAFNSMLGILLVLTIHSVVQDKILQKWFLNESFWLIAVILIYVSHVTAC